MIQFFSQMLKLPFDAFVFSMEMLVKTIQGMQRIAYQGVDAMVSELVQSPSARLGNENGPPSVVPDGAIGGSAETMPQTTHNETVPTSVVPDGAIGDSTETMPQTTQQEERHMADRDLHDDMLKLVRYKILFVKRDYEVVFKEVEELVPDNTDGTSYTAWKIAEFIQGLRKEPIPKKWLDKPKPYPPRDGIASPPVDDPTMINSLPEEDKKYLRVYYEVMERYTRERFRYEERQIEILEEIAKKMN